MDAYSSLPKREITDAESDVGGVEEIGLIWSELTPVMLIRQVGVLYINASM